MTSFRSSIVVSVYIKSTSEHSFTSAQPFNLSSFTLPLCGGSFHYRDGFSNFKINSPPTTPILHPLNISIEYTDFVITVDSNILRGTLLSPIVL